MPSVLRNWNYPTQQIVGGVDAKITNNHKTNNSCNKQQQFNFNALPQEVQLDIFGRVNQTDRVTKLPLVCKHWERVLRQPSRAWTEFTFAPTFFRNDSNRQLSRWNATKDAINYQKLMQWLGQRIEGMKIIKLSDRFGSNENCKRMYDALLNNLPRAKELHSICFSFKSPLVMTYFLPKALPYLQSLISLKLETWNLNLSPQNLQILGQLPGLKSLTIGALYGYGDTERQPVLDGFPVEILNLTNLEELSIRSRGVIAIPRQIAQLKNLKNLNVEGCLVTSLPGSMVNMRNMREINLAKNRIHEHVDEILDVVFSIPGLQKLDLSSNQIQNLPTIQTWFSCAESFQLKSIDLSQNYLQNLPQSFSQLKQLQYLNLSKNLFEYIPNVLIQLKNLEFVDFSQCRQLQELDLTRPALIRQGCDIKLPIHILQQQQQQKQQQINFEGPPEGEDWVEISGFAEEAENLETAENFVQQRGILRSVSDVVQGISSLSKTLSSLFPNLDIEWI